MAQPEHLENPWAAETTGPPGDRLPVSRQRRGDNHSGTNGYDSQSDDQHERGAEGFSTSAFERVPPQDLAAEQSVLGGMLLSKDAIADVVEVLQGHDFYRPAHETVYQAILDLYAKGEPADPITVADELTKRGELAKVGGNGYLLSLVQTVPTAANAEYYAEIVHERAVLRRLVEAGTRITQMGYAADGDVDDIVNSAQSEIYAVTEQRTSEDYLPLVDIMEGALDEIEAIGSRSGQMSGVPTGFTDLDSLTNGLHPGQMIVIAARPAMGKALALDTPLPTPTGWTTMGDVSTGDLLIAADGTPTRVVATTDTLVDRSCYEVTFDDGSTVVADADHLWLTDTSASREAGQGASVRTTKEIAQTLHCLAATDQPLNHSVRNTAPLELPARELPIPPYVLGSWLGAGDAHTARITSADPELVQALKDEGFEARKQGDSLVHDLAFAPTDEGRPGHQHVTRKSESLLAALEAVGVLADKHIPPTYLRGSVAQRRELLAGLLDANGAVSDTGSVQFAVTDQSLVEGLRELVNSLGYRCDLSTSRESADALTTTYRATFTTSDVVFRTKHKRRSHRESGHQSAPRPGQRFITSVTEVQSVPVRCVQVDSPDHLYLAGRSMVPTHNSTLALDFARACSINSNLPSVIFSLEMGRNEIAMRLLSAEARVALHHMRSGSMTDEDWNRVARQMPKVTDAPLYIDDSPNLSMMEIRAKCRRLKQRNDLKLVVIDYLQLMQSGGSRRPESRQQEVSDMSRNLKLLAKELEVPVIALSQLNRGPEQRTDKKPMVSDLRESGCVTAGTRVLRADTGAEVTMGELLESGERDIPVWSLDESLRMVRRTMTHVFPSGRKEVFRLRLASGREIEATANHPFLTYDGWTPLGELSVGARVAVPRRTDAPARTVRLPEAEVVMLAHLLGEGCVAPGQPIHYTSSDEANLTAVEESAAHFGITPRRVRQKTWWHTHLPAPYPLTHGRRNPIASWLDEMGLYGKQSYERFLPQRVHGLPDDQVRLFLRHLWAADGSVTVSKSGAVQVYYTTTSEQLARDVQQLMLRLDIRTRVRQVGNRKGRPSWSVDVSGVEDQRRFLADVGVYGNRSQHVITANERLREVVPHTNVDTVPKHVWDAVREAMGERSVPAGALHAVLGMSYRGSTPYRSSPSRSRLSRVAGLLESQELELLATSDVYWDRIVSVESLGVQDVYDATVLGTHNFVANGINIHNSIEQDADMVILLHREDAYEKESPRAGEADLIVAKHRNGPTATITVAFQGHYSRFVDMAHS